MTLLTHNIVRVSSAANAWRNISFFTAHTFTFPILLDVKNVNGFRVQELKAALISFGVPESEHTHTKAAKLTQLKFVLSSTRASQGPFGALEDGRLIDSKNPVKDFCWWDLDGVCSLRSGRWLVGPFRTSNKLFYLTRPQLALLKSLPCSDR